MVLQCDLDPHDDDCAVGGTTLASIPAPVIRLAGPGSVVLSLAVDELLPVEPPHVATARIHLAGAAEVLNLIRVGDRDASLDERAATITAVDPRRSDLTVHLGLDDSRDGWRYRGRTIAPGAPFTLTTDRYVLSGSVITLAIDSGALTRP